jgi:hypothetical protein
MIPGRFLELYPMFTDDCEYGQEIRQAKEFPDALAYVEELQIAARSPG